MRWIAGVLIAIALGVGVFLLWPRSSDDPPANTVAAGTSTISTSTSEPSSSTSTRATASTTDEGSHVVETVEEAEEILAELWFGWFEGIYYQDEDRIREVVVLEETVETARESFGTEFAEAPSPGNLSFSDTKVLRSDDECLALWSILTITEFRDGSSGGVHVLRKSDGKWKRLSLWESEEDLWQTDCESSLP